MNIANSLLLIALFLREHRERMRRGEKMPKTVKKQRTTIK